MFTQLEYTDDTMSQFTIKESRTDDTSYDVVIVHNMTFEIWYGYNKVASGAWRDNGYEVHDHRQGRQYFYGGRWAFNAAMDFILNGS
jgi:hypothetical protein